MSHYTVDVLKAIVPAMQPAWLHVFDVWDVDGEPNHKGFADYVFPVLAYATAPKGHGAYLIASNDGPLWIQHSDFGGFYTRIYFGAKCPPKMDTCPMCPEAEKFDTEDVFGAAVVFFFYPEE